MTVTVYAETSVRHLDISGIASSEAFSPHPHGTTQFQGVTVLFYTDECEQTK